MALEAATTCSLIDSGGPTFRDQIIDQGSPEKQYSLCIRYQSLALATPQLLIVTLADHPPASVVFVGAQVRDLDQHSRDQVYTLKQLEIDVHVERHLPSLLDLLLLRRSENPLMLPLGQKTLSYQFLAAAAKLDVKECVVRVLDGSMSEPTKSKLDHGPVVEDLGDWVGMMHRVLEVRHEHQIASLVP